VFDTGVDSATFLDEIPEGSTATVFIVATIPFGQAEREHRGLTLTAIAASPAQAARSVATSSRPRSPTPPLGRHRVRRHGRRHGRGARRQAQRRRRLPRRDRDARRDQDLQRDQRSVQRDDPAKRIPGAVVEYCITVQNNGSAAATSVVLTDVLTTQPVTYQAGSLFTVDTGATCTGGVGEDDDATGVDEVDPNGASESSGTVSRRSRTCRPPLERRCASV